MADLLSLENVETYYDLIYALRGVSLTVAQGSVTAILGSNGAGKSTILKTVMGLIEDQPEKGSVFLDGARLNGKDTEDIVRLGVTYVPEGREVFEELSVRENLLLGAHARKDRRDLPEDFDRVWETFPVLANRKNQVAGTLSGGEQQMLAIGRALMSRPRLLLLDEPSLGLSPLLCEEIFSVIRKIRRDGVTIVLVEQNARKALAVSDNAYILENGRFVLAGKSEDLAKDRDVQEFYMGVKSTESVKGFQRWKRKKRWR
ncbi:MAG: ABC transporter ATP-binding protein [Thermodesulfobacteriota bacterium]